MSSRINLRNLWVQIHLWLGLSLGMIGALIGLTGSVLVFDHEIDSLLNPQRYAVSGDVVALPYSEYLARAAQAVGERARPANLRLPEGPGMPLTVLARGRGEGPGFTRVYLDPKSGKVLEAADGGGLIGWAHNFHESLTMRQFAGREIVGAVGVAMLISSLSGLYLWWPGRARLRMALGPRRGFNTTRNLHYLFGFYGALMLAMLSFTGIYLAFPDAGRATVAPFSPLSPPTRGIQAPERPALAAQVDANGAPAAKTNEPVDRTGEERSARRDAQRKTQDGSVATAAPQVQSGNTPKGEARMSAGRAAGAREAGINAIPVDEAAKIARALYPAAQLVGISLPAGPRGVYRVGLNPPAASLNPPGGALAVFIDPANGSVLRQIDPASASAGDRYLAVMRPLHAASGLGLGWQLLYALTGLLPPLLAVTGTLMWLRKRKYRVAAAGQAVGA